MRPLDEPEHFGLGKTFGPGGKSSKIFAFCQNYIYTARVKFEYLPKSINHRRLINIFTLNLKKFR